MDIENCVECGQRMTEVVKRNGSYWNQKRSKFVCECGFETSKESDTEKYKRVDDEFQDNLINK